MEPINLQKTTSPTRACTRQLDSDHICLLGGVMTTTWCVFCVILLVDHIKLNSGWRAGTRAGPSPQTFPSYAMYAIDGRIIIKLLEQKKTRQHQTTRRHQTTKQKPCTRQARATRQRQTTTQHQTSGQEGATRQNFRGEGVIFNIQFV